MKRSLIIYPLLIGFFSVLIWIVIDSGRYLVPKSAQKQASGITVNNSVEKSVPVVINSGESVWQQYIHNIKSPLGLLLLQIITILIVSKLFGAIISRFRQPSVVGEMLAGIFLGPSVIGLISPAFSAFMFPPNSLITLQFLSQIGLAFFMFIIGMELDVEKLKGKAHHSLIISHVSIILPYFLGVSTAYYLYEKFAPAGVGFTSFALFMGIAVSITAFPVLARIIQERGLTRTSFGTIAIACAAFDDVTAWCILAMVIAIVKAGSLLTAMFTIGLALLFVCFMLFILRPFLRRVSARISDSQELNKKYVILTFLILLLSAYITETIGIHALFGAFLAGVIMPQKTAFKEKLFEKIEDISVLLLLPLFFAFTGLRTQIALLNEGHLWANCGLIILIAVVGKFGGSALSAKITGISWKDSLSIGALMNTRGLMELIVLNIGYDLGILSPALFAIMVIMAIVTTLMTGPLLDLIGNFPGGKTKNLKRKSLEISGSNH